MYESELLSEFDDRHKGHLVYAGAYQPFSQISFARELEHLLESFKDWRQRVYRFDNDFGASVVLYESRPSRSMTWDLVVARFFGSEPFSFHYADGIVSDLCWRQVQRLLDQIKLKGL